MLHQPSYLIRRGNVFYLSRRVPFELQSRFNKDRITISLQTSSMDKAMNSAMTMSERLELYWERNRLENFHPKEPGLELVQQTHAKLPKSVTSLEAARSNYLRLKGDNRDKTFHQSSVRNIGCLKDCIGHDRLCQITPSDAGRF